MKCWHRKVNNSIPCKRYCQTAAPGQQTCHKCVIKVRNFLPQRHQLMPLAVNSFDGIRSARAVQSWSFTATNEARFAACHCPGSGERGDVAHPLLDGSNWPELGRQSDFLNNSYAVGGGGSVSDLITANHQHQHLDNRRGNAIPARRIPCAGTPAPSPR
jgi:hypothetical protein